MKRIKVIDGIVEGELITVEARCAKCIFWERKPPYVCVDDVGTGTRTEPCDRGDCHESPRPENKQENDWCGKFKPE